MRVAIVAIQKLYSYSYGVTFERLFLQWHTRNICRNRCLLLDPELLLILRREGLDGVSDDPEFSQELPHGSFLSSVLLFIHLGGRGGLGTDLGADGHGQRVGLPPGRQVGPAGDPADAHGHLGVKTPLSAQALNDNRDS